MYEHPPSAPERIVPDNAKIRVGENGRIHGVDGMLDQIAGALTKNAARDVWPLVQRDAQLQTTIGGAVGDAIAAQYRPYVIVGVGALSAIALVTYLRWRSEHRKRR